ARRGVVRFPTRRSAELSTTSSARYGCAGRRRGRAPPRRPRGRPARRRRGRQVMIGSVVGMPVAMEMLSDKGLRDASARALELLVKAGRTVAVAESITAGMIGAALTAPAGASAAFRGGVIAYATELKHRLLAVPAD